MNGEIMKASSPVTPKESVLDILLNIRDIIAEISSQSNTMKAKIVGEEPVPTGNDAPSSCLIGHLQIIHGELRTICNTLIETNHSL